MVRVFYLLVALNIFTALGFLLFRGPEAAVSSFVASISYMVIMFATFKAYKNLVLKNLEAGNISNEPDVIDKIDDRYGLWDEDEISDEQMLKKIKAAKRFSLSHSINDFSSSFFAATSIYRILSYLLLIVLFFIIRNSNLLDIVGYISGFVVSTIGILGYKLKSF